MKTSKKTKLLTSESLRQRSDNAITAFKNLISALKITNDEAEVAKAENTEKIALLEKENTAIDLIVTQNDKIIKNVAQLLGIE